MRLKRSFRRGGLIQWGMPLFLFWASAFPAVQADNTVTARTDDYYYRMKGKVRLLLFWVGKDDVGGGTITFSRTPGENPGVWQESIEVLFGSKPERVPGKVNRWGYGRETAFWIKLDGRREPELVKSIFQGFMRHSNEESLSEVRENNKNEQAGATFWYDGIRSVVLPQGAHSEIHYFSAGEDFDYRNSKPIHCGYQKRLEQGPPNKKKKLSNKDQDYRQPLGFLTAIQDLTGQVLESFQQGKQWTSKNATTDYVYNAKLYQLKLEKVKHHNKFGIPLAEEVDGRREQEFENVVQEDFELKNIATGETHDFSIWVPLQGEYKGIPIRIEDKPRWWLRIELNLELNPKNRPSIQRASLDNLQCGEPES